MPSRSACPSEAKPTTPGACCPAHRVLPSTVTATSVPNSIASYPDLTCLFCGSRASSAAACGQYPCADWAAGVGRDRNAQPHRRRREPGLRWRGHGRDAAPWPEPRNDMASHNAMRGKTICVSNVTGTMTDTMPAAEKEFTPHEVRHITIADRRDGRMTRARERVIGGWPARPPAGRNPWPARGRLPVTDTMPAAEKEFTPHEVCHITIADCPPTPNRGRRDMSCHKLLPPLASRLLNTPGTLPPALIHPSALTAASEHGPTPDAGHLANGSARRSFDRPGRRRYTAR